MVENKMRNPSITQTNDNNKDNRLLIEIEFKCNIEPNDIDTLSRVILVSIIELLEAYTILIISS